ncbi:BhlA/UviB family holin-like peptide [Clostridium sp.]|uniref:BhlA/UviB family holin-like peptide n=1 Tax=Clostridium sp. TaxID=1506 RepID=UPI003D6D56EE
MGTDIVKIASSQGIWATLSVFLVFYILKTQEKRDIKQDEREQNYQNIVSKLTNKFNIVDTIKKDLQEIKEYMIQKKNI